MIIIQNKSSKHFNILFASMDTLQQYKDISQLSNFKTPATARWYFEVKSEDDLVELKQVIDFAYTQGLKVLFVWWGTNMLFAFDEYNWVVIKNNLFGWSYDNETKKLETYSNEDIWEIAEELETKKEQDLWHRFIGLPGSIGGAVFGNAGCFGLEIENNFSSCTVLNLENGQIQILSHTDMNFGYRTSLLKQNEWKYFIVKICFDLSEKKEKYHSDVDNIYFREHQQPNGLSCGSFFKNPSREQSAWYLIEQVWLKWHKIWWAFFSQKHANFLMSDWTARYQDFLQLIALAQHKVQQQFDRALINEVRIITN